MESETSKKAKMALFKKGCRILWVSSPGYIITILFVSSVRGLISPINTIVWQQILDTITSMIEIGKWQNKCAILLATFLLLSLGNYIINEFLQNMKQTYCDILDKFITCRILNNSMNLSMEKFDDPNIYNHLKMASSETGMNCLSLLDVISETVCSLIQAASYIYIIISFNWLVVPISIVSALPLLYVSMKIGSYWYEVLFKRSESDRLIEYLKMLMVKNENIKEVKLYNIGQKIINRITTLLSSFIESDKKARKKLSIRKISAQAADEIISMAAKVMIIVLGISSKCTIGTIVLYFNSQDNLKASMIMLINQVSQLHKSLLYMESIDVIDRIHEDSEKKNSDKKALDTSFNCIEFKNVSFKYPGSNQYALRNVSVKIENSKTYSIVGFNGSGKTTFIKLLLRLYTPTEGQICIDGESIESIDLHDYYKNISAVFQDFIKLPFSLRDNVVVRDDYNQAEFEKAAEIADITGLIDKLPEQASTMLMKDWSGGVDISQGQWQKIAIARSCYGTKAISILDEPFSSLDARAESQIIDRLSTERRNHLTIYVTHRFSSISLADEILVMNDGTLVEVGTHSALMDRKGLYHKLYITQLNKLNKSEARRIAEDTKEDNFTDDIFG